MKWKIVACAFLVFGVAAVRPRAAAPVAWEQAFSAAPGAPPPVTHYRASYAAASGARHEVEVWRAPDRVRRRIDRRVDVYAHRDAKGGVWFEAAGLRPGRVVGVSAVRLLTLGVLPDWRAIAGAPPKPVMAVVVRPQGSSTLPGGACRWYTVEAAGAEPWRVCWSSALDLPLAITATGYSWWVTSLDTRAADDADLEPPEGSLRVDSENDGEMD